MKYQIILESDKIIPDDEFEILVYPVIKHTLGQEDFNFQIIEARSLEGIRKEVYEKKEELKEYTNNEHNTVIEDTFEDISSLFKIKE